MPRPFYHQSITPLDRQTFSRRKKRERNQCSPWGSFSTCQTQNQWCHLSASSEARAQQGPEICPGAREQQPHKFPVLPPPSWASKTTWGATSHGSWVQTPRSALQTDLRARRIPRLPTFPQLWNSHRNKSLGGENTLGMAKPIREGSESQGDWNTDGIMPNRARNSSGKTKHLEA